MPRKKLDVERSLRAKGFRESASHHNFFTYHTMAGLKSHAYTKTSHTAKMKDIPDSLLGQMAKQCLISKHQFLDLVDCPLSRQAYEALIIPNQPTPGLSQATSPAAPPPVSSSAAAWSAASEMDTEVDSDLDPLPGDESAES